ncbi:hypothetical protein PVAG01_04005 [Phlyctema vagabunda]|uniref:DUF7908 domain-containing protein n=1 Tax=Phlyctema vagabunda TaxID=108571 RepID=A0ABR4PN20_9HELO
MFAPKTFAALACIAGSLVNSYEIVPRQEICYSAGSGAGSGSGSSSGSGSGSGVSAPVIQVYISTQVVTYPVFINTYVSANTIININGGVVININNAPTSLSTTVTASSTTTITSTVTATSTGGAIVNPLRFLLGAAPAPLARRGSIAKRQEEAPSSFVGPRGSTVTNCSEAAVFLINGGQLTGDQNEIVSTNTDVPFQPFGVSPIIGNITTEFTISDDVLFWNNTAFENDVATFCNLNGTFIAVFNANITTACVPQILSVIPAASCVLPVSSTSSSSSSTTSSTSSTVADVTVTTTASETESTSVESTTTTDSTTDVTTSTSVSVSVTVSVSTSTATATTTA